MSKPAVRYGLASILALVMDFILTMTLRFGGGLSLTLSAALAFIVTGVVFYFIHEFWTFRHETSAVSTKRLVKNLTSLGTSFSARIGVIGLLEWLHTPGVLSASAYFVAGAGVSFTLNYLINKYWVFSKS
ncbi:GtrA family protein [uncultured Hyphomonas sp.]|uniref:GtrA family protein n=1 Tax=uncultured Hyphomonas sp. TaxID=225298 RepID=UPI0030DBFEF7|tara:strand:+ start:524 stop:913 length:390 start_codon:yes stop_codon:yes gene_type:complete